MIMMECLGLSFLYRKVTKVVTNSASIRRLARHSGITVDASLRLSLFKTKAQAKQEHRNYHTRRAQAAVKQLHSHVNSRQTWLVAVSLLVAPPPVNIRRKHLSSYGNSLYPALVPLFCRKISSCHDQLLISLKTYTYRLTYHLTGLIVLCPFLAHCHLASCGTSTPCHPAILYIQRRRLFSAGEFCGNTIPFTFVHQHYKQRTGSANSAAMSGYANSAG
jgi:hypothetical protein